MSKSIYIDSLGSKVLSLSQPIPVEISGVSGNYVATWMEGKIEGEGRTEALAINSLKITIVEEYTDLSKFATKEHALSKSKEQVWQSLLNVTVEVRNGEVYQRAPNDEYRVPKDNDDYDGPVFG